MAVYSITDDDVTRVSGSIGRKIAGEDIVAGESLYSSSTDGKVYLTDVDATAEKADIEGIALNDAAADQPVDYLKEGGTIDVGAGVGTTGDIVVLHTTAGKMIAADDAAALPAGAYVTVVGVFITGAQILLDYIVSGVQKPSGT